MNFKIKSDIVSQKMSKAKVDTLEQCAVLILNSFLNTKQLVKQCSFALAGKSYLASDDPFNALYNQVRDLFTVTVKEKTFDDVKMELAISLASLLDVTLSELLDETDLNKEAANEA